MIPTSISIANFKSFGSTPAKFPLRPITLIFGPNSSGKSSLLQSLMYLDDVMENGDPDVIFPRAGKGKVDLGGFRQTLHRKGGVGHIVMGLTYKPEILPVEQRKLWATSESITMSLTLGPLGYGGPLAAKTLSLELDGLELLRASRNEDGPFKIQLFDFSHPAMRPMIETMGVAWSVDPSMEGDKDDLDDLEGDNTDIEAYADDLDPLTLENFIEYHNFLITKGAFELESDDLLGRTITLKALPDLTELPEDSLFYRLEGFSTTWAENLSEFHESTLPKAFEALFRAFRGYTRSALSSINHVPPLRDLPPRVFDLNQHPDPLWRKIANEPALRKRINGWLGAEFMKTRYELNVREYVPADEVKSRVPTALDDSMMRLFQREGFGTELDNIMNAMWQAFEKLDKFKYIQAHPDLHEKLIEEELANAHNWASDDSHNMPSDREYLFLTTREKHERARQSVENYYSDESSDFPDDIWEHYQENNPDLRTFLSENWDSQKEAKEFNSRIVPAGIENRKEISLSELPANIKVSLQDVGVGISQVLPVLMTAFGEQESIVAVEQPEIHIHPALQAELADVFIESALGENKNTFLLETHSEHLILRLLKRVRETTEGDFSEWTDALKAACPDGIRPEDIAVIYVPPGDEGAEIIELPITPDGDFSRPWPSGFFTERAKELY